MAITVKAYAFGIFRVIDPTSRRPYHFSSRAAADCFAARLEIAAACLEA